MWQAREWEWTPSPRRATRAWQVRRWQQLLRTVLEKRTAPPSHPPIDAPILQAWEAQLQGRPGERSNQSLRWQADGVCLRLIAELPPEPNFHLAYAREDARLGTGAAMQVQLARRYPEASWLVPFRLIDLPGADGARARYLAVWQDKGGITGQLWLLDGRWRTRRACASVRHLAGRTEWRRHGRHDRAGIDRPGAAPGPAP
ncbi:hypothetical protein LP419_38275 [Massilia sp. H-1]|nr:hypothetical protein LP419_38275 [Massilia sp. H-1]